MYFKRLSIIVFSILIIICLFSACGKSQNEKKLEDELTKVKSQLQKMTSSDISTSLSNSTQSQVESQVKSQGQQSQSSSKSQSQSQVSSQSQSQSQVSSQSQTTSKPSFNQLSNEEQLIVRGLRTIKTKLDVPRSMEVLRIGGHYEEVPTSDRLVGRDNQPLKSDTGKVTMFNIYIEVKAKNGAYVFMTYYFDIVSPDCHYIEMPYNAINDIYYLSVNEGFTGNFAIDKLNNSTLYDCKKLMSYVE